MKRRQTPGLHASASVVHRKRRASYAIDRLEQGSLYRLGLEDAWRYRPPRPWSSFAGDARVYAVGYMDGGYLRHEYPRAPISLGGRPSKNQPAIEVPQSSPL